MTIASFADRVLQEVVGLPSDVEPIELGTALPGFVDWGTAFPGFGHGAEESSYLVEGYDAGDNVIAWEVGRGRRNAVGALGGLAINRLEVFASSNDGAAVDFSGCAKAVVANVIAGAALTEMVGLYCEGAIGVHVAESNPHAAAYGSAERDNGVLTHPAGNTVDVFMGFDSRRVQEVSLTADATITFGLFEGLVVEGKDVVLYLTNNAGVEITITFPSSPAHWYTEVPTTLAVGAKAILALYPRLTNNGGGTGIEAAWAIEGGTVGVFEPLGAVADHAALTDGVHGITAFGATVAGAADAAAARTAINVDVAGTAASAVASHVAASDPHTVYALADGTRVFGGRVSVNKTSPSLAAPTYTTPTGVGLVIAPADGATGRGLFISSSTATSTDNGVTLTGSSASASGRTSILFETTVTAQPDRYATRTSSAIGDVFRVAGSGAAQHGPGSLANPSVSWISDTASGFNSPATSEINMILAGVERWRATTMATTYATKQIANAGLQVTTAGALEVLHATPTTLTADAADYAIGDGASFRVSSNATRTITGIASPTPGRRIELLNVGANDIVLANESFGSTAANRFTTFTGGDLTIPPGAAAQLVYDDTSSRWRVVGVSSPRNNISSGTAAPSGGSDGDIYLQYV